MFVSYINFVNYSSGITLASSLELSCLQKISSDSWSPKNQVFLQSYTSTRVWITKFRDRSLFLVAPKRTNVFLDKKFAHPTILH